MLMSARETWAVKWLDSWIEGEQMARKKTVIPDAHLDTKLSVNASVGETRSRISRPDYTDAKNAAQERGGGQDLAVTINSQMVETRIRDMRALMNEGARKTYPDTYKTLLLSAMTMTLATGALRSGELIMSVCDAIANVVGIAVGEAGIEEAAFRNDMALLTHDLIERSPTKTQPISNVRYDADRDS